MEAPKRRRTEGEAGQDVNHIPIGFKALEKICSDEAPANAILELVNKAERFEALLCLEEIRPDLLKLVISSFRLLCTSSSIVTTNAESLLRSPKVKTFITGPVLSRFINEMPYLGDPKLSTVINDLAVTFMAMIQRFGANIVHDLPLAQLSVSLASLKEQKLTEGIDDLEKKLKEAKDLKEKVISQAKTAHDSEAEPPQNFREINVIPDAADFLLSRPFLRENVTDRKYKDFEHYLDVQFRLLREDFVMPLRDGIKQLRNESSSSSSSTSNARRAKDVSAYFGVTVLSAVYSEKGRLYRIRFDQSHRTVKRVNWDRSKRLKYGSLLCLSSDDFNSFVLATVQNRDANGLKVGELEVRFENVDSAQINQFIQGKEKFVMVESPAYFEAYRHVLEALKEIKAEEFPFQRHIVECCQDVRPPEYHLQFDEEGREVSFSFDFSGLLVTKTPAKTSDGDHDVSPITRHAVETDLSLKNGGSETQALNPEAASAHAHNLSPQQDQSASVCTNSSTSPEVRWTPHEIFNWPDKGSLGFNESQMRAFKLALTKQFAVIQGPPGTGKTFVGLKIARALLENVSLWKNGKDNSPILMVSYTNHALDQFLEGLLPMPGIVRVGGRSKSQKLERCSLKILKANSPRSATYGRRVGTRREITAQKISFQRSSLVLKASRSGVISLDVFMKDACMRRGHYDQFFPMDEWGSMNDELLSWLFIEASHRSQNYERDDALMEVATTGYSFDDEDGFQRDDNTALLKIAALPINGAEHLEYVRRNLVNNGAMTENEEHQIHDVHSLNRRDRWRLYRLWRQRLENLHQARLQDGQEAFEEAIRRNEELEKMEVYDVLKNARVIGMTTTCAAKYRHVLQQICPKIVLIEEAAEVLEAHIITSLTKGCQHLILIGDHQQLRPNPAVYELAKKYKLDVSLFERMVNVGVQYEQLSVQHRMRPEIAALLKHIYEDLENHESVEHYEDIKGLTKNMFFINHCHLERHNGESHSHTNEHEATFLVALCYYLLQQGYKADQITILTTYMGQMFTIRDCLSDEKNEELKSVRLTTVDNFQGEENDIILLSLVRSNMEEKVGFINITNRACVALSRAKMGFYCIGNFDLLSKHSDIWNKIVADLKASNSIGTALPLVCQIHNDEVTAETAEDFSKKAPDGGCQRKCEVRLECGHACKLLCHPRDVEHENYVCREPCARSIAGCTHLCSNRCGEPCQTSCGELVEKALPECGHIAKVKCGKDVWSVFCEERCSKILSCGHTCQSYCNKPCTTECNELVKRRDWPCGHEVTIACSATPSDCSVRCAATLECGHQCKGTCGKCLMGRVHQRCNLKCGRSLVCSHQCKEACSTPCPPCSRKCENRCVHSQCKKTCSDLCKPCMEPCLWGCQHYQCSKRCHEICDRPRCNEPCKKILECCHVCRGLMCEKNHECICVVCTKNDASDPITKIFLGGEDDEDALFIKLPDCGHIFAVSDLDRYMDMVDDTTGEAIESHVIQMKRCPRCSTTIRLSLRYGKVINQQLQDVEKVKAEMHQRISVGLFKKTIALKKRLDILEGKFNGQIYERMWAIVERSILKLKDGLMAALLENKVMLLERFISLNEKWRANMRDLPVDVCKENNLSGPQMAGELSYLQKRFMSEGVTQRELKDINTEFSRLNLQLELCLLSRDIKSLKLELEEPSRQMMTALREKLSGSQRIDDEKLDELMKDIATIRRAQPKLNPLTPEEKKQIVSAVGLSKGHWYKCPNGHIYAIGECGGAMERSTCPECKAVIGGERHKLEKGNELAPEMDGARYSAWSEQANLQNYEL